MGLFAVTVFFMKTKSRTARFKIELLTLQLPMSKLEFTPLKKRLFEKRLRMPDLFFRLFCKNKKL